MSSGNGVVVLDALDRTLLAERDDCLAMADVLIAVGQGGMAFPWLLRAGRIHNDLKRRRVI